jgi:hypothetical protein
MRYEPEELQNLQAAAGVFLDWFSPDQSAISFSIVTEAVAVAKDFPSPDLEPKLMRVQKRLPAAVKPPRSEKDILAEIDRLGQVKYDDPAYGATIQKIEALNQLHEKFYCNRDILDLDSLRISIPDALQRLRCLDNPQALQDLACSGEDENAAWALARLKKKDKARFLAAAEWLAKTVASRKAFELLVKEDPQRATAIAQGISPDEQNPLAILVFSQLAKANVIPNEGKWIRTLLNIIANPQVDHNDRRQAIGALVPAKQPRRFSAPEIDATLISLLQQRPAKTKPATPPPEISVTPAKPIKPAAETETTDLVPPPPFPLPIMTPPPMSYSAVNADSDQEMKERLSNDAIVDMIGGAAQALARRGRIDCFDAIQETRTAIGVNRPPASGELLQAMIWLAQADPAKCRPRLISILRSESKQPDCLVSNFLIDIWAADLRELKPELENFANSGPEDQSYQSYSSTGTGETAIEIRLHEARQIVAIWNEEDPATKGRLLLAFGLARHWLFDNDRDVEFLVRLKSELATLAVTLTPEQKLTIVGFLKWYQEERIAKLNPEDRDPTVRFITMAKELLKLP